MASRFKATDQPEPWIAMKKGKGQTSSQKEIVTKSSAVGHSTADTFMEEPTKRGRGRPKAKKKVADAGKGKHRVKSLTTSAVDVVLSRVKTTVPNVEELRRKREEDAIACGRHVRSILESPNAKSSPLTRIFAATHGDCGNDGAPTVSSEVRMSPTKNSRIRASIGDQGNAVVVDASVSLEQPNDCGEALFVQHPDKERLAHRNLGGLIPQTQHTVVRREQYGIHIEEDKHSEERDAGFRFSGERRTPSPQKQFLDNRYQGRLPHRNDSAEDGQTSRQHFTRTRSRSPHRHWERSCCMQEHWSPGRMHSRSPSRGIEGRCDPSALKVALNYEDSGFADHFGQDYQNSRGMSSTELRHRGRCDLSFPEKGLHQRRCHSVHDSERFCRRSRTPAYGKSPSRMSSESYDARAPQWRCLAPVKAEDIAATSAAGGRRQRRHEQALCEEGMDSRQRNGKKPFYLTLDAKGKPHGPGRPAWIAEISKLAAWLDPLCMHIRKQTYKDVQTFKDRLNDSFDYSGTLNEDYLRGLMGKAVTKRRSELIALIKNNKERPLNVDKQIWLRLENLSTSKQREEKSEQGRYANACQKTLGRIGAGGVNGIREKLRSLFQRSPDPDEVEEEMQRDKGFGGQKRKNCTVSAEREDKSFEMNSTDEDRRSDSLGHYSHRMSSDGGYDDQYNRHVHHLPQISFHRIGRGSKNSAHDLEDYTRSTSSGRRSYTVPEMLNLSKDEYIETLKAEIEQLQSGTAQASSSNSYIPCQSPVSMPDNTKEGVKHGQLRTLTAVSGGAL